MVPRLSSFLWFLAPGLFHGATVDDVAMGWMASYPQYNGYYVPTNDTTIDLEALSTFDVFLGPFCEDSKQTLPTMIDLAKHYASEIPGRFRIRIHIFPLPYNLGSWIAAQVESCFVNLVNFNNRNRFQRRANFVHSV